jgi:hypothetical protein
MNDATEQPDVVDERKASTATRMRLSLLLRALGEIGIVTVGILIAFALDAWWDDRSMARREQVHLRALASDFQQNVDELKRFVELEQSVSASCQELLLRARASESAPPQPLTKLMLDVFNSARYEPVMGAYEALVNSAGLTLIQDHALRGALAQFAAKVKDQYAESWSTEHYFALSREFGGRILLGVHDGRTEADREREYHAILREPSFQRHLVLRYYGERDLAREYGKLLQQAEAVLAQVRQQIHE